METVFYNEAAELLGISVDAIRHSVSGKRKALTVLPRQGQRQRLIKNQVMLFKGKRLSLEALSMPERKLWERYANEATVSTLPASGTDLIRAVAREEVENTLAPFFEAEEKVQALQSKKSALKEELAALEGEEERYRKDFSLLFRKAAQAIA